MCGIVYVKRLDGKQAQKQVLKRYSKQQHRGSEGFGYIGVKSNGAISPLQRTQFEHEIRIKLGASSLTEILYHHRYPTSTPNVPESAHPLLVANKELQYNYYVVHNGVLQNEEDLKEIHEKLGYKYLTEIKTQYRTKKGHVYTSEEVFNDSEAFAIELARTIEGLQPECNAKGAIAYIAYQVDKASGAVIATYFGTNGGNPLMVQRNKEFITICSEGAGTPVEANKAYRIEPSTSDIVECSVKLQPFYTPSKIGYYQSTGDYKNGSTNYRKDVDYDYGIDMGKRLPTRDEDLKLYEIEQELDALDDEIIGVSGDVLYSKNEGDEEAAEQFAQDYNNLMVRRKKLQAIYEQKANTTA